jgi:hypothetical protein
VQSTKWDPPKALPLHDQHYPCEDHVETFDLSFEQGHDEATYLAKQICTRDGGCPILESCRQWATAHGEQGVWGGTDQEERRLYSRRHRRLTERITIANTVPLKPTSAPPRRRSEKRTA